MNLEIDFIMPRDLCRDIFIYFLKISRNFDDTLCMWMMMCCMFTFLAFHVMSFAASMTVFMSLPACIGQGLSIGVHSSVVQSRAYYSRMRSTSHKPLRTLFCLINCLALHVLLSCRGTLLLVFDWILLPVGHLVDFLYHLNFKVEIL